MIKPQLFEVWTHGENAEPIGVIAFEHVEFLHTGGGSHGINRSTWFDTGEMLIHVATHGETGALMSIGMFCPDNDDLWVHLCPYPSFVNKKFISIREIITHQEEALNG